MNLDLNKFVNGFVSKEVKKLYLAFLYILEDFKTEGILNEETFTKLRKRVLDYGNNCQRNIVEQLDNLDIQLVKKNNDL
jgi:hypothetical protein